MKNRIRAFTFLSYVLLVGIVTAATAPAQTRGPSSHGPLSGNGPRGDSQDRMADHTADSGPVIPWIDVHSHLVASQHTIDGAVIAAVAAMDQYGMTRMIIMPTPNDGNIVQGSDCNNFPSAIRKYGSRFAFLGGGGSLNPMIQKAAGQTNISDSLRREFENKANEILKMGAIGFGEMAVRHLSLQGKEHPYESVHADHPLYLLLSDIAAKHDVPIDIHLDVTTNDIPTPTWLTSPNNPKVLNENLAGFERLLDHNPKTKICWEHLGSDNTGHWTVDLSRRLLAKHPNLYMSLRLGPGTAGTERQGRHAPANYPMAHDGGIRPEWLQLFKDFPSRFMIGDDGFIVSASDRVTGLGAQLASKTPLSRTNVRTFLNALPADLAQKIAVENATVFYKLAK